MPTKGYVTKLRGVSNQINFKRLNKEQCAKKKGHASCEECQAKNRCSLNK
jgi:hypothetical protein